MLLVQLLGVSSCSQVYFLQVSTMGFSIQANRGCSKGAGCSARQNTGRNDFVGPKITPPDPVLPFNWT